MAKQEENRMDEKRFAGLSARIGDISKWARNDLLRLEGRVDRVEQRLEERMDRRFALLDERIDRR
jgi:hypothetical protein